MTYDSHKDDELWQWIWLVEEWAAYNYFDTQQYLDAKHEISDLMTQRSI